MQECLLVIVTTPTLEETLVDWLLARENLSGFSSNRIDGHSRGHSGLSLAEQVMGRQRKVMFHIHTGCDAVQSLLAALRADFGGAGLHYWVMPLIEAGHIG